uniref:Uncharacterized protein n=1 Tax=Parascaris equorum TaxID=6256 RepID=A0A914SAK3_PAREQ
MLSYSFRVIEKGHRCERATKSALICEKSHICISAVTDFCLLMRFIYGRLTDVQCFMNTSQTNKTSSTVAFSAA